MRRASTALERACGTRQLPGPGRRLAARGRATCCKRAAAYAAGLARTDVDHWQAQVRRFADTDAGVAHQTLGANEQPQKILRRHVLEEVDETEDQYDEDE